MTSIAACPRCASNLQMPPDADAEAWAACPVCGDTFCVSHAPIQPLPVAAIVPPPSVETLSTQRSELPEAPDRDNGAVAGSSIAGRPAESSTPTEMQRPPASSIDGPDEVPPSEASSEPGAPDSSTDYQVTPSSLPLESRLPAEPGGGSSTLSDEPGGVSGTATEPNEGEPSPSRLDTLLASLMDDASLGTPDQNVDQPSNLEPPADRSTALATVDSQDAGNFHADLSKDGGTGEPADPSEDDPEVNASPRRSGRRWMMPAALMLVVLGGAYLAVWGGGLSSDNFNLATGPEASPTDSPRSEAQLRSDNAAEARLAAELPDETSRELADAPASEPSSEVAADASPTESPMISDSQVRRASAALFSSSTPELPWSLKQLRDLEFSTPEGLVEATIQGEAAAQQLVEGDLGDRETVRQKGGAYMTLAALAEQVLLADPAVVDRERTTQRLLAKALLQAATLNPKNREDLAQIAARWLQFDKRPNRGALLVGTVVDVNAVGRNVLYTIELEYEGGPTRVDVLMDNLKYHTGDEVAVVGLVIDRPTQQLRDYPGAEKQLVLSFQDYPGDTKVAPSSSDWLRP